MTRRRARLGAGLALALALLPAALALAEDEEEEEEEDLQQMLTEREDKRRPLEPFRTELFGHPFTLGGEVEVEVGYIRPRVLEPEVDGETVREPDRLGLESVLEVEAFYTIGPPLSAFLQLQGVLEEDLLGKTFEAVSERYVGLGEAWLHSGDVLGSGVSLEVGHLDFEDDRRWWWDDELDAVRATFERDEIEIALAGAYPVVDERTDRSFYEPEHERVLRLVLETSWDFSPGHSFQLFGLHQDDRSPQARVGDSVGIEREDDEDARLSWLGLRQTGVLTLGPHGYLGYWLDAALVAGEERFAEYSDAEAGHSTVLEVGERDLDGWALDLGASWLLPYAFEPRLFAGYARGSEEFRQTGVQENEAGFGGVERFDSYGLLLRPELANLEVVTLGAGISVFRASSLDLVYHHYRLVQRSEDLVDSELQLQLDGTHRQVGDAVDLVLAVEEWERFEFDVALSVLRTSNAVGIADPDGPPHPEEVGGRRWVFGAFAAVRFAF